MENWIETKECANFLQEGSVMTISFDPDQPPEGATDLGYTLNVGPDGQTADLKAAVKLQPHFRLLAPSFDFARGAPLV